MAENDGSFVLPAGVHLSVESRGLCIENRGNIVIEGAPAQPLHSLVSSDGDVILRPPDETELSHVVALNGRVVLEGKVSMSYVHADTVEFTSGSLRVDVVKANSTVILKGQKLEANVIVAPRVEVSEKTKGRATAIACTNDIGPHKLRGGFTLAEFVSLMPAGAETLAAHGIEVSEDEEDDDEGEHSRPAAREGPPVPGDVGTEDEAGESEAVDGPDATTGGSPEEEATVQADSAENEATVQTDPEADVATLQSDVEETTAATHTDILPIGTLSAVETEGDDEEVEAAPADEEVEAAAAESEVIEAAPVEEEDDWVEDAPTPDFEAEAPLEAEEAATEEATRLPEDPLVRAQLHEALDVFRAAYGDSPLPQPIQDLGELANAVPLPDLRGAIPDLWNQLMDHHKAAGAYLSNTVSRTFEALDAIARGEER